VNWCCVVHEHLNMLYSCSARVDTPVVTAAEIKYFKTSFFYHNHRITLGLTVVAVQNKYRYLTWF